MRNSGPAVPTTMLGLLTLFVLVVSAQSAFFGRTEAGETPEAPRWSIQTHPALLAGFSMEELRRGRIDTRTITRALKDENFPTRVETFLETAGRRGFAEVIVEGMQPELKGMYFRSPLLEKKGWTVLFDVFEVLREKGEASGIGIGIELSQLGVHARGLYDDEFGLHRVEQLEANEWDGLLSDLQHRYDLSTLGDEEFPAAWFPAVREVAERLGLRFLRRVSPDDILSWTGAGQWTSPLEALSGLRWASSRDYFRLVHPDRAGGVGNGAFPLLLSGRKTVVHSSPFFSGGLFLNNLILFRSLESAPQEFSILLGPEELENLPLELIPRAGLWHGFHDPERPLMNLVVLGEPRDRLDAGHVAWLQLASSFEAILSGAGAAGFRTEISGTPIPEADAYYVYLAGLDLPAWLELEKMLSALSERPILIQPGAEISDAVQWRMLSFLGISKAEWNPGELPSHGTFARHRVRFRGVDLYRENVPSGFYLFEGPLEHVLMADDSLHPLLYRNPTNPRRFFVNGTLLHREMAFPLSQLLTDGRGFQRPADCAVAVGHRTAFWALQDTEVDWVDPRTGARLVLEMRRDGLHLE